MKIKFQNFFSLLGISLVGQLLFILFVFAFYLFCFCEITPLSSEIIDFVFNSFPYIAIIIGIINFFSTAIAQYIYNKSKTHLPRLQWYSMFFGWAIIADKIIDKFNHIDASIASCIIAALCFPDKTWKQRIYSALKFLLLLCMVYLFENMED